MKSTALLALVLAYVGCGYEAPESCVASAVLESSDQEGVYEVLMYRASFCQGITNQSGALRIVIEDGGRGTFDVKPSTQRTDARSFRLVLPYDGGNEVVVRIRRPRDGERIQERLTLSFRVTRVSKE